MKLHKLLADQGIRIFKIRLGQPHNDEEYFIHPNKTVAQWREDVAEFRDDAASQDEEGWAGDDIFNRLMKHMHAKGYVEIDDVISDIFEGRITCEQAKLVDDPDHDDIQADGFGHYGWESKPFNKREPDEATNHEHVNQQSQIT